MPKARSTARLRQGGCLRFARPRAAGARARAPDYDGVVDLRLRHLAALDARSLPLPHGTEVTTRVERVVDGRRVPLGSVGRVAGIVDDEVDVVLPGIGTLRYARADLVPRRVGQALFAARRAGAWEALERCIVLRSTVGSRAWGLADEGSDHDERGVFAVPFPWTGGLVDAPDDLVSHDGSSTFWSLGKAVRQALRADPNTLEMLFVRDATATDEIGAWLLAERDAFVSVEIYGSFGRYALGQLARLEKALRLAEHRAVVLEWLRAEDLPTLDAVAGRLAVATAKPGVAVGEDDVNRCKLYVKQLYRSMHDQGLLDACELAALARFARERSHDFDLPRELRPKNAYNLVRLIDAATRWLRDGAVELCVDGPLRERLLAIKRGEVPLADVLAEAEGMAAELEKARDASRLPLRPDVARADALLRRIAAELARRHVEGAPGPLGRDAPAVPEVAWAR